MVKLSKILYLDNMRKYTLQSNNNNKMYSSQYAYNELFSKLYTFKNIHEKNNNHYHNTTYNEYRSTK